MAIPDGFSSGVSEASYIEFALPLPSIARYGSHGPPAPERSGLDPLVITLGHMGTCAFQYGACKRGVRITKTATLGFAAVLYSRLPESRVAPRWEG